MNREILFRGKTKSGSWVEGNLAMHKSKARIIVPMGKTLQLVSSVAVIRKTVGQFTGIYDRFSKRVFEGDRVQFTDAMNPDKLFTGVVGFKNGSFVIDSGAITHYRWVDYTVEVIGNIHNKK